MASLKELTEDTTDRQSHNKLAHLKAYAFFVFYQPSPNESSSSILHKLTLKLKHQKNHPQDQKSTDQDRQLQLLFYNLNNEQERMQGLIDLKITGPQSNQVTSTGKSKVVAYCQEEQLLALLETATNMNIDINNLPVILVGTHPNSDLSIFSGWNETDISPFSQMDVSSLENESKKWIQSAQERVDSWKLNLSIKEEGRLQKLEAGSFQTVQLGQKRQFQQSFISHLSLGYHVKLSKKYQQAKPLPNNKKTNSFLYGWERFKNFCCLGHSNLQNSTGVVSISYRDDKGEEYEILKHLRQYDGSQESEIEASKTVKSNKQIYSLLVTNIDRFHGSKLEELSCKPGDGKIQIILFEGANKWRRIASVKGEILLKLESQCVEVQIGQSIYRCWGALQIRITHFNKLKVAISREALSC